jgi:ATP-binding cassette subfamily E protein 1
MVDRIAVIDRELFKDLKLGPVIANACPINKAGEECITIDPVTKFPMINEKLCIGCGLCVKAAERAGCYAITIVNLPHELKETPIHRFGPNEFVLFRLPYPIPGEVVGILGPNGTGKTTALDILSGGLKPNLGDYTKTQTDFSSVIKMFRGTELQRYLERLEKSEIRTSVKPQRVDKIPSMYEGKVSKLLEKVDERKIVNDLLKTFQLEHVIDSEISEISGGELQRVAIAACLAKDADVYYLDEPTSFLDVFQRLNIAKVIRETCKDRSVMIVDHDLATLDFLADRVHIFYGTPGVYGIVSKPYGVRVGINAFLDGYVKEDNVRIRSEPITFFTSLVDRKASPEILVSFVNIEKKLDGFELKIRSGDIRKQEAIAILGANALGKTTFARILAGEIKPDTGMISCDVKISYKPQYIQTKFSGTVQELLSTVADTSTDTYKSEILRPLELERLLEKNVQELSGGELQRVSIALCLSRYADLYLLDEPSAFLDVEQRLTVAKLINKIVEVNEKSVLVIDHDLLFLSKVGDRAMVFLGKSGVNGYVDEVTSVRNAFNTFLKEVGVTFRMDKQTGGPRANKLGSQLDVEQKESGNYFYV